MDPRLACAALLLMQIALATAYPFVVYPADESLDDSSLRAKRAFDRLENGFGMIGKRSVPLRSAFDRLDFGDFSMRRKRAFDRLDFSDFSRKRRAFDRLDFSDFSKRRKRSFDRIEHADFGLSKRSIAPVNIVAAVENEQELDEMTRRALVHDLAGAIQALRQARAAEKQEKQQ